MPCLIVICVWTAKKVSIYMTGNTIPTFKDYLQAWEYIRSNNLPAGASACEIYD